MTPARTSRPDLATHTVGNSGFAEKPRLLYVFGRESRFVAIDRDALADEFEVVDWTGKHPAKAFAATLREVRRARVVVCWFAGFQALLPVTLAWLLRTPTVVITGGYDVARVPEAGYGMQRTRVGRTVSRWILRRATRVMANSEFGRQEALRAVPAIEHKATVVHHGVPDLVGGEPDYDTRNGVLTVSVIDVANLERKGLLPFVRAARDLPQTTFFLVGGTVEEAAEDRLRAEAPPNVTLTGRLSDEDLATAYGSAAAYVQASLHEGFGMAVAEAMLAGAVPVVTPVGALPEVVGDAGIVVERVDLAAGIEAALAASPDLRRRARERVRTHFTLEQRAAGLKQVVRDALQPRA